MFIHETVLKEEAVEGLKIKPDGTYVDCTMGGAGHSVAIASRLSSAGRLIALDQDEQAIAEGKIRLEGFEATIHVVRRNFKQLKMVLEELQIPKMNQFPQVDGILFDLGVSSPQLDQAERGFSYQMDAPLDMRMDQTAALTAYEVVNEWEAEDLAKLLRVYGEERFASRIARKIVQAREHKPIERTGELAEMIKEAIPAATRRSGPHPAKRSFQAIRIAVNDELGVFKQALEDSIQCLTPGGRISVITFHSLEDRICKQAFTQGSTGCICPPDFPMCVCGRKPSLKKISRKPIVPREEELDRNPRARSAKLRIAEKL